MLFNTYEFLFGFLPITLVALYLVTWYRNARAAVWVVGLASLVFYGLGNWRFLGLLIASVIANYLIGNCILLSGSTTTSGPNKWLVLGVTANLAALGYFKYANFFLDNIAAATGWHIEWQHVVLPVGISFFTFTQIAFLVDCGRGRGHRYRFWDYLLFVSFFPHLVAGPILNHQSILPQIQNQMFGRPDARAIYRGLMFFSIGLFKKVLIADSLAPQVTAIFEDTSQLGFVDAWAGTLFYTFQLYYDFSGYSEMAVGLALLINVEIPLNFNSPYKSHSIIEFWRRWHMSLSAFLRDYLYIPLGGNRLGTRRRYVNLLTTMVLGGLWHGAGWTFLAWGTLHGVGLALNHAWRDSGWRLPKIIAWPMTFAFVVVAWVFFRSPDLKSALDMFAAMLGLHGSASLATAEISLSPFTLLWIPALGFWVAIMPNTQDIVLSERPRTAFALACAVLFSASLMGLDRASEFLYFQF